MPFEYICTHCGKTFERDREKTEANTFCSTSCYHAWTKRARDIPCPVCGKLVSRPMSAIKAGRRYCSRECFLKATAAKTVEKVCPGCGKTFTVNASVSDRFNHCSWECRSRFVEIRACQRCGKEFKFSASHGSGIYCSEACYRPPVFIECKNCGKTFRKLPGDADRQFCCFACYRGYSGETSIERRMRLALDRAGIGYTQEARMGRYSIDFLITDKRVALEVDGDYWHQDPGKDAKRDKYLAKKGWHVIRVTQSEMENIDDLARHVAGMLERISAPQVGSMDPPPA